ncbi:DUF3305 domain-containing protein [Variovorax sp. OV329]|uniref:DUF3305 domain-containing protein n=1 Tax=Variovorax sp. OV329 TaxID=1882825 RepID=UPI0008EF3831|nr:DUF3305 domain-containing protein [Variovorax sp. OV329]SFM06349.1 Protein of unknown function [Variovorax sp. OV329]
MPEDAARNDQDPTTPKRPYLDVAVLMRRERVRGPAARWQEWRWVFDSVLPDEPGAGTEPRLVHESEEGEQRWLHPGFVVELFADDAEGYYLNASTESPCWFVLWRLEETATVASEPIARPVIVTLSYHDAGRWLDAQEMVEQVPAQPEVVQFLRGFVEEHYKAEPKRRQRPQSFRPLTDRFGNVASVSTSKKRGAGDV